jgi:hypothetical protein
MTAWWLEQEELVCVRRSVSQKRVTRQHASLSFSPLVLTPSLLRYSARKGVMELKLAIKHIVGRCQCCFEQHGER